MAAATAEHRNLVPSLRDGDLRRVLLVAFALQVLSWSLLEGYQLADSVEYMERAQAFVRGEPVVDSTAIRGFGFPALLTPFFALADAVGARDFKPIVQFLRLFQVVLGLGLVRVCARIGARFSGRRAGLACGLVVAFNPIFLQYTVSPVSGLAAALCFGLAFEHLLEGDGFRRGLRGGLWLGAALLMAYKTLILGLPLLLLLAVRRRARAFVGALSGYGAGFVAAIALDKLEYGTFGRSLELYLVQNFGSVSARIAAELGFTELARNIFERSVRATTGAEFSAAGLGLETAYQRQPVHYYLTSIDQMLVWPVLLFVVLGLVLWLRRPSWKRSIVLLLLVFNVLLMSYKGSKDFRLWLPLLPLIAPLAATGFAWIADRAPHRGVRWGPVVAWALLLAGGLFGVESLLERNTRRFAGYWRAMAWVDSAAPEDADNKFRVSSAWHWAVFLRESPAVELVKLPHQLEGWRDYTEEQRAATLAVLRGLDGFLTHLPLLTGHPDLMAEVNREFEVGAAFYDREVFEDIGPILVLEKRSGSARARTFFDVLQAEDPSIPRSSLEHPLTFVSAAERISLVGWSFDRVPGDDHAWLTYFWSCATPISSDFVVLDRVTTDPPTYAWHNDHLPAYGLHPASSWRPGSVLREGWLMVAAENPFDWRAAWRPLGAGHDAGEISAQLWIVPAEQAADGSPAVPWPLEPPPDSVRTDAGGRVLIGGFVLPVTGAVRARTR